MASDFERALTGEFLPGSDRYRPETPGGRRQQSQRASRTTTRQPRTRPSAEERVREVTHGPQTKKTSASGDLYGRLADLFHSQPWIAAHRGSTEMVEPLPIDTGVGLTAKILRERIAKEPRLEGRSDDKIEEVVEYAMKHFFDRLPNDARAGRLVNQFVSTDWWDTLLPEAIDHWVTVRIPQEAFDRGKTAAEAFYAAWPKKETSHRPKTPQEAAQRFLSIIASTSDQPDYDDCEPLL